MTTIYEETTYKDGKKTVRRLYESSRCILRLAVTESTEKRAVCYDRLATLEEPRKGNRRDVGGNHANFTALKL